MIRVTPIRVTLCAMAVALASATGSFAQEKNRSAATIAADLLAGRATQEGAQVVTYLNYYTSGIATNSAPLPKGQLYLTDAVCEAEGVSRGAANVGQLAVMSSANPRQTQVLWSDRTPLFSNRPFQVPQFIDNSSGDATLALAWEKTPQQESWAFMKCNLFFVRYSQVPAGPAPSAGNPRNYQMKVKLVNNRSGGVFGVERLPRGKFLLTNLACKVSGRPEESFPVIHLLGDNQWTRTVALNPGGGLQQQTQAFANPPYFDNSDGKRFTGTVFLYKPQGNDGRPASTQTGECNLTFQQYGGVAK